MKDDWEVAIYNIFHLARVSNGFGMSISFEITKEYCKEYGLNHLEVFKILKNIDNKVSSKS